MPSWRPRVSPLPMWPRIPHLGQVSCLPFLGYRSKIKGQAGISWNLSHSVLKYTLSICIVSSASPAKVSPSPLTVPGLKKIKSEDDKSDHSSFGLVLWQALTISITRAAALADHSYLCGSMTLLMSIFKILFNCRGGRDYNHTSSKKKRGHSHSSSRSRSHSRSRSRSKAR